MDLIVRLETSCIHSSKILNIGDEDAMKLNIADNSAAGTNDLTTSKLVDFVVNWAWHCEEKIVSTSFLKPPASSRVQVLYSIWKSNSHAIS